MFQFSNHGETESVAGSLPDSGMVDCFWLVLTIRVWVVVCTNRCSAPTIPRYVFIYSCMESPVVRYYTHF